jgi:hypothetical protein
VGGARPLATPRSARVGADAQGRPHTLDGVAVESIREEWVVEDRWWTGRALRRRYFELVLVDGRDEVAYRDLEGTSWFSQRA